MAQWFRKRGIEACAEEMTPVQSGVGGEKAISSIPTTINWVVVLGGDGTLLGAARRIGSYGVPILGVNLGGLGFLTAIPLDQLYPVIEMMIAGGLHEECRVMLETKVLRQDREVVRCEVLNDVVVNKRTLARVIDLQVSINNEFLTIFRADGLIIATPTGSTAYNLSAGGPILHPTTETFIITPICPFTLSNRPIIIPDTALIQVQMGKQSEESVVLTFDGQVGFELHYGDRVMISKSCKKVRLLRPPDHSYFRLLRTRLMWGGATYNKNADH